MTEVEYLEKRIELLEALAFAAMAYIYDRATPHRQVSLDALGDEYKSKRDDIINTHTETETSKDG